MVYDSVISYRSSIIVEVNDYNKCNNNSSSSSNHDDGDYDDDNKNNEDGDEIIRRVEPLVQV